ncbi:hypothetical protein BX070DRAFT_218050 [Coemansia spiralis]|nr:hypothetical protein BX070DRAFT_218050 [Coemansia spiralis]
MQTGRLHGCSFLWLHSTLFSLASHYLYRQARCMGCAASLFLSFARLVLFLPICCNPLNNAGCYYSCPNSLGDQGKKNRKHKASSQ